ncbi:alpha/beta hydrolase [uncultured Roseibium sp.]|uniref:alpha/beta hydrolase n=1 Tax=uncultured Roseibium sp. TaxID=1936171 RepID=UPI0026037164|nr:alpha/beta hydrolase [uncultured Roseibium sp.]
MSETEDHQALKAGATPSGTGKRVRKLLINLIVVFGIAYIMAAGFMYLNQRNFLFVPTGELTDPAEAGLDQVTVETVTMADGTQISVWSAAPAVEGAPTVLYFHGNSGNVSTRASRFKKILDSGFGLYAPSYRGYAGSDGSPTEIDLISDGREHFESVAGRTDQIIIHGESMGTGVATAIAAERPETGLLVLEAPYTALVDRASEQYPWLPVGLLMIDQMPTRERVGNVQAPILIVHGTQDVVIPVEHGKKLYERAEDPKEILIVEGAAHNNLWSQGLWPAVLDAWRKVNAEG